MKSSIWLFKTEPSTYSFSQLLKDRKTNWNNIRNYQARNFLRTAQVGDLAVIYHSGDEKSAVGLARVIKPAYSDGEDWVQIDIEAVEPFKKPVTLAQIKAEPAFEGLLLIRQSRLSVMPVSASHFSKLKKLGGLS